MGNGREEIRQPRQRVDLFGGPSFYYKSMQVQLCNYRQMPKEAAFEPCGRAMTSLSVAGSW